MGEATATGLQGRIETLLAARTDTNRSFFAAEADRLGALLPSDGGALRARRAADRRRLEPGGALDVRHVAVEFVHPVIVGKRAPPAIGLGPEGGRLAEQLALLAESDDIVLGFGADEVDGEAAAALAAAIDRGCMTSPSPPSGRSGSSSRRPRTHSFARSLSRRSTTCSGSWCTSSSTTAACSAAARRYGPRQRRLELSLPLPGRERDGPRDGDRGRSRVGADEGRRGRGAARADADREWRRPSCRGRRAAPPPRRRRQAARVRQRRFGDRRFGPGG